MIQHIISSEIKHNISLKDKNWFYTGGPAQYYAEPVTKESLISACSFAHDHNLNIFFLGSGANILISDKGFNGLVIRPCLTTIAITETHNNYALVSAGAGTLFADLIAFCLAHNLLGLEEFSGIPGTVGGSVFINIHYFEFLLSNYLVEAEVIEKKTGIIQTVDNSWFNFGYNKSTLQDLNHFLVSATFCLKKANNLETAFAQGRNKEIARHREKRYPMKNTCGSFFRNFTQEEVANAKDEKKPIFVAYYLDKIGIKGTLFSGDAVVSYQHANMIVNNGTATSQDIIDLARKMQTMVKEKFSIIPQPECQLIGFDSYPLLKE